MNRIRSLAFRVACPLAFLAVVSSCSAHPAPGEDTEPGETGGPASCNANYGEPCSEEEPCGDGSVCFYQSRPDDAHCAIGCLELSDCPTGLVCDFSIGACLRCPPDSSRAECESGTTRCLDGVVAQCLGGQWSQGTPCERGCDGDVCRTGSPYAGNWTGRFGSTGTYGLSFVVTDDAEIVDLEVSHSILTCLSGTLEIRDPGPVPVVADSFTREISLRDSQDGWSFAIDDTLTGTFTSESTVSGTFTEFDLVTDASTCLEFGSPVHYSMVARKDCGAKPAMGPSATRFCP